MTIGKRLFRQWVCMPLRVVKQITERFVLLMSLFIACLFTTNFSQDAVQDLIDHPTFEADFSKLAKGLPDLERIVSRIHARNCKVKEFLKVLEVFHFVVVDTAPLKVNIGVIIGL